MNLSNSQLRVTGILVILSLTACGGGGGDGSPCADCDNGLPPPATELVWDEGNWDEVNWD